MWWFVYAYLSGFLLFGDDKAGLEVDVFRCLLPGKELEMGRGIRRMRRWVAIGLSCVLVAGLVPAASFAQGASAVDAVRESLQLDASDAVASDAAVAVGDSGGGAVSGGVLVAGLEATAAGEEGSAAAAAGENGATGASSATEEMAAGIGVGDADVAAPVGGIAASAVRSADGGDDSDSGSDGGSAPDYDGTEASYAYDEYYEQWFLVTAKGVTGEKVEDDGGYVAGAKTPAQAWLTLDEDTGDLAVHHVDAGATAFEVPATVDGRPIVKVGGCGSRRFAREGVGVGRVCGFGHCVHRAA